MTRYTGLCIKALLELAKAVAADATVPEEGHDVMS